MEGAADGAAEGTADGPAEGPAVGNTHTPPVQTSPPPGQLLSQTPHAITLLRRLRHSPPQLVSSAAHCVAVGAPDGDKEEGAEIDKEEGAEVRPSKSSQAATAAAASGASLLPLLPLPLLGAAMSSK